MSVWEGGRGKPPSLGKTELVPTQGNGDSVYIYVLKIIPGIQNVLYGSIDVNEKGKIELSHQCKRFPKVISHYSPLPVSCSLFGCVFFLN